MEFMEDVTQWLFIIIIIIMVSVGYCNKISKIPVINSVMVIEKIVLFHLFIIFLEFEFETKCNF